jgi:hypothetical protein
VNSDPASCQNDSVETAADTDVRSPAGPVAAPRGARSPSGVRPMSSGESRTTHSDSGSSTTSMTAPAMKCVCRHPKFSTIHIATGTSRLMPAIDAAPRSDSAVAARRVNQRAMTADATTCPHAASPNPKRTP